MLSRISALRRLPTARSLPATQGFWTTTVLPEAAEKKEVVRTADLIKIISHSHDLSIAESKRIVTTLTTTISEALASEKMVTLTKFGTFTTYESKGRNGRNPQTGETIHIPTKERIKFKPYESLKKAVEGEPDE